MSMFSDLTKKVSKPSKRARKSSGPEIPRTIAFVRALQVDNLRLSYAALADASELLGEHTATGMSAGQRGSALCRGSIPGDLQPNICNATGSYAKGMEWDEAPDANVKELRKLGHVRPENVEPFVQAFINATAKPSDAVAPEGDEDEVIADDEDDDATEE